MSKSPTPNSPSKRVVISTLSARGGVISGRVITVLVVSMILAVTTLGGLYLYFRTTMSSGM
jgi:hypothetical protein